MARSIFVNLPVRDLEKSKLFFSQLGFEYNRQFTDDKAACMVVNDSAFVMLLAESFFKTFTTREICDTARATEGICGYSTESRAEVDSVVERAVAAGGREPAPAQDYGFMYSRSFTDLDGHHWEVIWMNPSHVQG